MQQTPVTLISGYVIPHRIMKILVTEDNDMMYNRIEAVLQGHDLTRVNDGCEAVQHASKNPLDLILMKMRTPTDNGLVSTKAIREFNSQIPIFMLSDITSEEAALAAYESGADRYLRHPLSTSYLRGAVNRLH